MRLIDELALLSFHIPLISSLQLGRAELMLGQGANFKEVLAATLDIENARLAQELLNTRRHQVLKEFCQRQNIKLTWAGRADYPNLLIDRIDAVSVLTYVGDPVWQKMDCLSVVGSRYPSPRAILWMDRYLPEVLRAREVAVVSGGARGIDQKAHALSLLSGRPTVCFQPSGLMHIYPPSFASFGSEIVHCGGALVSIFAPDERMFKSHFHRRNRYIAAMATVLIMVEAQGRSGSLLTGRLGLEMGIEVCTLPTFPTETCGQGNLNLLSEGALMIRDAADVNSALDRRRRL